jgi:hypothetical protein
MDSALWNRASVIQKVGNWKGECKSDTRPFPRSAGHGANLATKGNCVRILLLWRWRQQIPLSRWKWSTKLHGVTWSLPRETQNVTWLTPVCLWCHWLLVSVSLPRHSAVRLEACMLPAARVQCQVCSCATRCGQSCTRPDLLQVFLFLLPILSCLTHYWATLINITLSTILSLQVSTANLTSLFLKPRPAFWPYNLPAM